jgi:hypothetical protein
LLTMLKLLSYSKSVDSRLEFDYLASKLGRLYLI